MGLSLDGTAGAVGRHRWWEMALFGAFGRWASEAPEPEAKLHAARVGPHAAWRAEVLESELSEIAEFGPDARTEPGSDGLGAWWREAIEPPETVLRLVVVHRLVVPRLLVSYRELARRVDGPAGSSLERAIAIVVADHERDRAAGEALIESMLDADRAHRCGAHVGSLEAELVGLGGLSAS